MKKIKKYILSLSAISMLLGVDATYAACSDISRTQLTSAIATAEAVTTTGGYSLNMWATVVDETGMVCHVATSGVTGAAAGN